MHFHLKFAAINKAIVKARIQGWIVDKCALWCWATGGYIEVRISGPN